MERDRRISERHQEEEKKINIIVAGEYQFIGEIDLNHNSEDTCCIITIKNALIFISQPDQKSGGFQVLMFPFLGPTNNFKFKLVQSPPNYLVTTPTDDIIKKYENSLESYRALQSGIILPRNKIINPGSKMSM